MESSPPRSLNPQRLRQRILGAPSLLVTELSTSDSHLLPAGEKRRCNEKRDDDERDECRRQDKAAPPAHHRALFLGTRNNDDDGGIRDTSAWRRRKRTRGFSTHHESIAPVPATTKRR